MGVSGIFTGVNKFTIIQEPELAYTYDNDSVAKLVWYLTIEYIDKSSNSQKNKILIDAVTGVIVGIHPQIKSILDREVWDAESTNTPAGITLLISEGGSSTDSSAQDLYDGVGVAWNYFKTIHNIDSYDDAGSTIHSTVHFRTNWPNAHQNGGIIYFGDGDGVDFGPFTDSGDIIVHEYVHAIIEFSSALIYLNESGAINEAMSDIFGASAIAYDIGIDSNTWKVADENFTPGTPNDALRYMNDPALDGSSVDYYPDRYTGLGDSGGVHSNSGIANLAYYLLVNGGTHPRGKTTNTVGGIGISKAEKIFFRAMYFYMTSSETFEMARNDTARAAGDLYGLGSNELLEVCSAWDAVGVDGQDEGYCDLTPDVNVTAEYIGCSPQNSPRYFVSWYAPGSVLEYDADYKRNGSAWNSFYNGTQGSAIYTDETYATSYIRAKARGVGGWGGYDQVYLGPKTCNGGPIY